MSECAGGHTWEGSLFAGQRCACGQQFVTRVVVTNSGTGAGGAVLEWEVMAPNALDRAALEAENEMLREAAGAYFVRSLVGGRLPADVAGGRQARRALADILATPPGAAGQALLDAADQLERWVRNAASDAHFFRRHPPYGSSYLDCEHVLCQEHRLALDAYRQARSGAPSAAAPGGQPSCEGGGGE